MNVIERFKKERGQIPREPTAPRESFKEYGTRTKPWLQARDECEELLQAYGPERALELLNERMGLGIFMPFTLTERFVPEFGKRAKLAFLIVPGGCQWALKRPRDGQSKAGCGFCEFQDPINQIVGDLPINEEEFSSLITAGMTVFREHADKVRFFSGGSPMNPGEIPIGTMELIARYAAASPRIRELGVEARTQFIVPETLAIYQDILKPAGKTLEVMIGFETQDDALRNGPLLNKGMTRKGFLRAVEAAKAAGARVAVYVILMPVKMTEREAVAECIKSIRFLADCGVDEVMLQLRYSHHSWVTTPKLWSGAHVLWETRDVKIPVTLGDWRGEYPPPVVWPKNCGICDDAVIKRLDDWRETLDPEVFNPDHLPSCECRKDWEKLIAP